MIESILVALIVAAFFTGMLVARSKSKKEIVSLKEIGTQQSTELEQIRTTSTTKSREFKELLTSKLKQHADELMQLREEHRLSLDTHASESRERIRTAENKAFEDGFKQAELRQVKSESTFSVQVRPYVAKIKDKGFIYDDHYSAIGFQYQLLVSGIPCFQPHVVIEQEYQETEFNEERLKWLTEQAFKAAQLAIQASGAQNFITIVDSPLVAEQTK